MVFSRARGFSLAARCFAQRGAGGGGRHCSSAEEELRHAEMTAESCHLLRCAWLDSILPEHLVKTPQSPQPCCVLQPPPCCRSPQGAQPPKKKKKKDLRSHQPGWRRKPTGSIPQSPPSQGLHPLGTAAEDTRDTTIHQHISP